MLMWQKMSQAIKHDKNYGYQQPMKERKAKEEEEKRLTQVNLEVTHLNTLCLNPSTNNINSRRLRKLLQQNVTYKNNTLDPF